MDSIQEIKQEDFPLLLKEINDPPKKLYVRGNLPDPTHILLCVVGARKYTSYGKTVCEELIAGLAGLPVSIISGLALGIDGIAHRSAIKNGISTFSVPGSGLLEKSLYPASHLNLSREILQSGGGLISEFEPTTKANTWTFPQRNRIMAGMCHATLIIEAEKKSGTLITARLAMEYNRNVLTVPGSIFSSTSQGPHYLIQNGATPITSAGELREGLGFAETEETTKKIYIPETKEEEKILSLLKDEPMERDELLRECKLPTYIANSILMSLEIKGVIKESGGKIIY